MLQDWYWAACPVTCAINFSSKVKFGLCCLHMSYISNSFDTNGTTLRASCARAVVFLNRVCVVFSSVPLSPSAIIYHTAVFNFPPHGCLFYIARSLCLLPNTLCYWSTLWHTSLSVSTEHGIISLSGFSPVFTNTSLLDTHTHDVHMWTHMGVHLLPGTTWGFNFYWLFCFFYSGGDKVKPHQI